MGKIEDRLAELGLELPPPGEPKGSYVNVVRTGNYIFTGRGDTGDFQCN